MDFQMLRRMRFPLANRRTAIILCLAMTTAIAFADWVITPNTSLGLLYFIPMLLAAAHLKPGEIALLALAYAVLREQFSTFAWGEGVAPRLVTTFLALAGAGFLVREIDRRQKSAEAYARALAEQVRLREASEQQLRGLVEGSPAPILSLDPAGKVLMANEAAHQLLRCASPSLPGQSIDFYLPALAALRETTRVRHVVRTLIECTGHRLGGEAFLAQVWVSSYGPPDATGLSVVIFDSSEQLRNREEVSLEALATGARVIMGAFWHEIRNLCTAMRLSVNSLQQRPDTADTAEVEALQSLINGLERMTASGLQPEASHRFDVASLRAVLDQAQIVIEPWFQESQIAVRWHEAADLALVRADHYGLLQVCLNVARNAHRALENCERTEFAISATVEGGNVFLRFHNTGAPVADPDSLFRPFQPAAKGSGLGLYVSRAIARSFGGDLRYEPVADGCCFAVVLERAEVPFILERGRAVEEDQKTRVLLLDDHTIFRQGVARLLNAEPDMELHLHTGSVGAALLMVAGGYADVVLLDLDLGQERGIDFLAQARRNGFAGPVLVLTAGVSPPEEEVLRRYGIAGILGKDASVDALAERIREAAGVPAVAGMGILPGREPVKQFTAREAAVLRLVVEGLQNKEIASALGCTEAAVKGNLQQLFHKTGTRMRSQLVRFALEQYRNQI